MTARKPAHLHQQAALFKEQQTPREAFRCIRNYLAGQFVGATRDDTLLDEVLKCLFCKLIAEREEQVFETDTIGLAKQVRALFSKVRRQFPEIYPPNEENPDQPGQDFTAASFQTFRSGLQTPTSPGKISPQHRSKRSGRGYKPRPAQVRFHRSIIPNVPVGVTNPDQPSK